jgi:hypothetical protein
MGTRKDGLTTDDWHETLTAMRPAYETPSLHLSSRPAVQLRLL